MREKGTPSRRPVYGEQVRKKNPVYPDRILRENFERPMGAPVPDPSNMYKQREPGGRVIRALSSIMQRGNRFQGTF
jgi:hypothetical protein